ncbi:MAG: bifunctional phosphopantothenoylcysteine decarboxylase/phosphopantothenate synthase [Acidobacteriota bacterium]
MAFVGLGVTGGIGAYKAVEVARLLQKRGHRVQAVMTRAARKFVGPLTFEAITREPVITSQFLPGLNAEIEHIALASGMDALAVVPATANILGKFAHGIADDFLTSLYLATRAPVIVAPAMNSQMWSHDAVQTNIALLQHRGVRFVDPGDGYLACGWIGKGRLAEPEVIVDAIEALLASSASRASSASAASRASRASTASSAPSDPSASMLAGTLAGRRVLVTAGPTFEDIDPVRFIGNRSSGRMGFALARAAHARGADVTLIAGPTPLESPAVGSVVRVRSAHEMHAAVMAHAEGADVVIMAAAVADYTPAGGAAAQKIHKGGPMTMTLERTADILGDLGRQRGDRARPVLIGFAAETGDPIASAQQKLVAKRVDLVVANDVSAAGAGFDVDTNRVTLIAAGNVDPLPLMSKDDVADIVLDRAEQMLAALPAAAMAR